MTATPKTIQIFLPGGDPQPSPAAVALMGRPANGCLEWKIKDGETLDALKRQVAL